jgi:rRNA-processing protein EBP2
MARSKLKSALDNQKGRNVPLEKQRKQEKEAKKRKEKNKPQSEEEDSDVEGGVPLDEVEVKINGKTKDSTKPKKAAKSAPAVKEPDWETEGSEDEDESDDDDDAPERPAIDLSHLEDSESDISSDEEEMREQERKEDDEDAEDVEDDEDAEDVEDDDEDEDEDDIPLSDIESLASEDKGDIIPHQRLTINNTTALTAALNRIQLPYLKLAFSEYQSVVTDEPVDIPDIEDDLNRELAFYKQCLSAVKDARSKLKKEGAGFSRPADYFAEMVKSDEHMGKIKQKLIDEAAGKKASAEARKQRDLKKFGKQVQVAKMQERAKEKRDTIDKINTLKRSTSTVFLLDFTYTNKPQQNDKVPKSATPTRKTSSTSPSTTTLSPPPRIANATASPIPSAQRRTKSSALAARRGMRRVTMPSQVRMVETFRSRR